MAADNIDLEDQPAGPPSNFITQKIRNSDDLNGPSSAFVAQKIMNTKQKIPEKS
jgi:hypothetical protein